MTRIRILKGLLRFSTGIMKIFLFALVLMFSFFGFSQEEENSIYFPQEQLIHPECDKADDKNACLVEIFENQVFALLNEKKNLKSISKGKKDTLSIGFTLLTTENGLINKESSNSSIRFSKDYKKIDKGLNQILNNLPGFKVLNRKNDPIVSKHFLTFRYLKQKLGAQVKLQQIKNEKKYSGGVIEEIPVFPGCENLSQQEGRKCFNLMMQKHIASNFSYPELAVKKRISGRVSLMFIIDKDGKQTKLRMKGPDPILEKEAERIIKLLPIFKPGLQNGKAVRFPYSIPITFKLNK